MQGDPENGMKPISVPGGEPIATPETPAEEVETPAAEEKEETPDEEAAPETPAEPESEEA